MDGPAAEMAILAAAWHGALRADNAEDGYDRIRAATGAGYDNAALAEAVAVCLARGLIREPVRLPEGALQCHWVLELTQAGVAAARARMPAQH